MPFKERPKISIVTPSYNQGEYLEETIQSVLNQGYPKLEYIIIDGGSTDQSAEIIRKYEQYLGYWVSEKDRGQAHAINKGFMHATGDILAWLNSDDFYYPNTLNYIAQAYQKYPEAGLYIGKGYIVNKDRSIIRPFSDSIGFDADTLIDGQNYINQPSVFINRKATERVGFLDTSLNNEFDVEYWIRIGREFEAVVMDEFLSAFRWYEEIKTASSGFKRWTEMFNVRQRYTSKGFTPGLLVEFLHIARNEPLLNEMGKDIKGIIEKAYEMTFVRNQEKLNLTHNIPAGRGIYFIPDKTLPLSAAEEKISAPPLIRHTGSKPKVDIVLQATGTHSWGVYAGWANAAHKLGILNRVFFPKAEWGDPDVTEDDGLWSYLLNPRSDIMLLPGFDWHSQMLHIAEKWQERWTKAHIAKILFSHETIERSCIMFENNLMKDAAVSAAQCVDGIVYIDMNDASFWKQTNKPSLWQLLGVDDTVFRIRKSFRERKARPFFRGQFTPHFTSKTYSERREFMQFLMENNAVEVLDYIKGQKPDRVVEDFNNYQIAVNLPTLSAYHPSRVTEALACGCALITNRTGIAQLDDLFSHKEHLLYYSTKEELLDAVRLLSSDIEYSERLAKKGHDYNLEHFTSDKLLLETLDWINKSDVLKGRKKEHIDNFISLAGKQKQDIQPDQSAEKIQSIEMEKHGKIIIDGVIFYLHKDRPLGISRLWKSLLAELSATPLADSILLLDRDSTAPFIPGIRWKTIKGYDLAHFEDDSLYLEAICREEKADLFISTYYTYPENSHCALMLYDMIPELTGMDLSLPEWRAKAKTIEKANAYFSISASTRNDFRKLYPHYSRKNIYLTHPAVSEEFRQNSSDEINSFREEHNIQKPYFMLVGHRTLYKNAHLFFRAFSLLENKSDYEILCTGGAKELEKAFLPYTKGARCQVRFLSDRDLSIAYSGAIALAYPSQYEGFGLPILEAMKSGCPVITCRNSSIPEVAGEAALYVDIHDVADMRDALIRIQQPDIRDDYVRKGFKNASRFTWGETGRKWISAIHDILNDLKYTPLNQSDPINTVGRLFYMVKNSSELLSAFKQLQLMYSGKQSYDLLKLLRHEGIAAAMDSNIFSVLQHSLTYNDGGEGFLYYIFGLALSQRQLSEEALKAYLIVRQQDDLCEAIRWRVTYLASEIAYNSGKFQLAQELLKEILAMQPKFIEGQKKLQRVEEILKQTIVLQPPHEKKHDTIQIQAPESITEKGPVSKIKVSAIVSAYNSERFIMGCLEDLESQTIADQLEIIVVNSGSEQDEEAIIKEFQKKYSNIKYIKTVNRETVYAAWNRGIKAATGQYITNANTDDRHRKNALEIMVRELDNNPDIALVYGDQIITKTENETFDHCTPAGYFDWPDYDRLKLFHCPCVGPQPIWRKNLHDEMGYFDESLKIAGDYDWWLRVSEKYPFKHIPDLLGLYFQTPEGIESSNEKLNYLEAGKVRKLHGEKAHITCDFNKYRLSYKVNEYPSTTVRKQDYSKKENPLVSVILTTFNRPDMLKEAINSIINQSYKHFEIIVVNDAGIDVSSIIESFNQPENILYLRHETNKGVAASRNTGINTARGKYIAYLDDDDIFYPDHIQTLMDFLETTPYRIAFTDAYRAYQEKKDGKYKTVHRDIPYSEDFDKDEIMVKNLLPTLCLLHEKACLDETGLFDENLSAHEDWELWIRLSQKFPIGHIKKVTCEFRYRKEASSLSTRKRANMLRTAEIIHAKHRSSEYNPSIIQKRRLFIETLRQEVFDTNTATVSIIIPTYNNYDLTLSCIEAIRKTADAVPYEIIVVDNGSSDMTPDYLHQEQAAGRIRTVINKENLGFSKANNQGANMAKGKYLIFLNNDTIPQPHWLEEMLRVAESDKNIGIVGSKMLFPDGTIQHAGVVFYKTRKPYHLYRGLPSDIPCANKQRDFKIVTGACMLIRKDLFFEISGFDERYINGCEDLDLCLKAGQKNKRVIYNPKSVVIHLEAQTEGREDNMGLNRKIFENTWKDKIQQDDIYYLQQDGMELQTGTDGSFRYSPSKEKSNRIKVSIIIVTFNSASTIHACLDSVLAYSGETFETIVVDNASSDETRSILNKYQGRITTIFNDENNGFSFACNQGIRSSHGEYIILLNPDTVVTPMWTDRMLAHFDPGVGAVGPLTNYVNTAQLSRYYVKDENWENIKTNERAEKLYEWNKGRGRETKLLVGFCMALSHKVLDEVGLLDEDLFLGSDDLELSWRLRHNGYKLIIATDTFIYHKGQVSFKTEKTEKTDKLVQESTNRLYKKLESYYGPGNVPAPTELWGIDWFRPQNACFRSLKSTFAAVYCVYDDITWLTESMESIYYSVDALYFLISDRPWFGQSADNTNTLECIRKFPDPLNKISIIQGTWANETDQRNAGLDILKEKGFAYCFAIDADEIYDPVHLQRMMDLVSRQPDIDCWHIALDTYWKTYRYRIEPREPLKPPVFLKTGESRFIQNRLADGKNHGIIPSDIGICHHLSYARNNEEVLKKITTFSHAHEVQPGWFENIWKKWDTDHALSNLHPTHPECYQRAVEQSYAALPPVLKRHYLSDMKIGGDKKPGLTSIIILAYNQWNQTELCLRSIEQYTPEPHEIIIVDNGSTDETKTRLHSLMKIKKNMKVISNNTNRGFSAGNNQAIVLAQGEYILLLNNDTIVTDGWLKRMTDVFRRHPKAGIVGPMSNYVSGPQLVPKVTYTTIEGIDTFAKKWAREHKGKSFPIYRVVGFCLLTLREVIDRIGGLDEQFGSGNFEDDDFCIRASLAGYTSQIAQDVFIHHTGSQTFRGSGINHSASLLRNWELFKGKWKIPMEIPYERGYQFPCAVPFGVSLYIPLPDISSDHQPDYELQWWEDTRKLEQIEIMEKQNIRKDLVSIVVLTSARQELTRNCIRSIEKHTPEPHEIILVPLDFTQATVKWLKKLQKEHVQYKLIETNGSTSYAKACNLGINQSSGESIIIVKDSAVLSEGWLSMMLDCLSSAPDIGIVGPMTVNTEGIQGNTLVDQALPADLDSFVKIFSERNRYRRIRVKNLNGFCMIFKKELIDKSGLFDEHLELTDFADDDFCLRAAIEGYQNMIAGDTFIYHHDILSEKPAGYSSTMLKDAKYYYEKWSNLDEATPASGRLLITNVINLAHELGQKGQNEKAITLLLESLEHSSDDSRLHYAILEMLIEHKKFKDALDIIDQMSEFLKKEGKCLELAGYCKEGLGLYDEADQYANKVLEINGPSAGAWNLKGSVAFKKALYADAEKFFFKAIEADRGFGEPYSNIGAIRWMNGERDTALKLFEKAFILSPVSEEIVTNYYTASVSLSKLPEAEKTLREALAFYPINRRLKFVLIDNLLQQEKYAMAMKTIEEALTIFELDNDTLTLALKLREVVGIREIDNASLDSISICMIVKNEENNLARCLSSIEPLADEVIVVDTGSTDRTANIAKAFGTSVYNYPWTDSFSDARNFSISKASGKWVLVLDGDEVVSPSDHDALKRLVRKSRSKPVAYSFVSRNYVGPVCVGWIPNDGKYKEESGTGWYSSEKVRLFPNDNRIRFDKPVHEVVEDSLLRYGFEIKKCGIPIHHYGKLDAEQIRSKGEKYYQLGKTKLEQQGEDDPNALIELAVQASELEKHDEALEYWEKLVVLKNSFPNVYQGLGTSYFNLGRYKEALSAFEKVLELNPGSKEAAIMYALCELYSKNAQSAIDYLKELLKKEPNYPLATLALAAALFCLGKKREGIETIKTMQDMRYSVASYFNQVASMLTSNKIFDYALRLLEIAIETNNANRETHSILAELHKMKETF
jgi:GT2 family glycosyltransferase/glycosyltransferase involved in cell wall biosynthesis/Flp pilus assembly protein TadD